MRDILEGLLALPVPLALLLVAGLAFRRRMIGRALVTFSAAALLVLCLPATAQLLARPLAGGAPRVLWAEGLRPDAVLVPTGGIYSDGAGAWLPSSSSVRRARLGARLAEDHGAALIVAGGVTERDGPAEATSVARILRGNVDAILETTARNTAETATAVAEIASRQGFTRVAVVTSRIHLRRLVATLRSAGVKVVLAATPDKRPVLTAHAFLPSGTGFSASAQAWHEYVGIVWYWVTGRIRASAL